jgi:hypothetical protein
LTFRKRRLAYHGNGTSELLRCDEIAKRIRKSQSSQVPVQHFPLLRLVYAEMFASLSIAYQIYDLQMMYGEGRISYLLASDQRSRTLVKSEVVFPVLADYQCKPVLPCLPCSLHGKFQTSVPYQFSFLPANLIVLMRVYSTQL